MIKFLTYIAVHTTIIGVIVYDYFTDTLTLNSLEWHPAIVISLTLILISSIYIYSFGIDKKTLFHRLIYTCLVIVDCGLSVGCVYLSVNNSSEIRQLNDPLMSGWKQERSSLIERQDKLDSRYNKLLFGETVYKKGAQRDGEHKMRLQSQIDVLNNKISTRETKLAGVGGKLNESLLIATGDKNIVMAFFIILGLIPPLCLPIAGMAYKKLGKIEILALPFDLVNSLCQQIRMKYLVRLSTQSQDIAIMSTNIRVAILRAAAIEWTLKKYNGKNYDKVMVDVCQLLSIDAIDKSEVSRIKNNHPRFLKLKEGSPSEYNKAMLYVQKKSQNKNS